MMTLLFALIFSFAWASPPTHWTSMLEIQDRHEFYQDNEVIVKPKGAWQTLFGVVYPDRNLQLHKDCVFYQVPGEEPGRLKIKDISAKESCEKYLDSPGDTEITDLKALQFSLGRDISFHFTFNNYRILKWSIPLLNQFKAPAPEAFTSSAHYRAPKITLLAPLKAGSKSVKEEPKKAGELCHSISDDCQELSTSSCQECPQGWYEVPNGCPQGPKYCGVQNCGLKNRPACRRGMRYQRVRKKFDCRTDSSFAYCAPGLSVQCEGARAYCR